MKAPTLLLVLLVLLILPASPFLLPSLRTKPPTSTSTYASPPLSATKSKLPRPIPVSSLPKLYEETWSTINTASSKEIGSLTTLAVEQCEDSSSSSMPLTSSSDLKSLFRHLDDCRDVCTSYGVDVILKKAESKGAVTTVTFEKTKGQTEEFGYDPMWDDYGDGEGSFAENVEYDEDEVDEYFHELPSNVPIDDNEIVEQSKQWVHTLMSNMGICPFTSGDSLAGLPIGKIRYVVTRCTTVEELYERYWEEVKIVDESDEKEVSTTLLIAPEIFMKGNLGVESFEAFSSTLTQTLETGPIAERLLQLVFFHPKWTFRDGGDRSTTGTAANYARRSPYPMINILRTSQVRRGQRGIPTGLVYRQNEKILNKVGDKELEEMLRTRNWDGLDGLTVDRSEYEALAIAKGLQEDVTKGVDPDDATSEVDYGSELRERDQSEKTKAEIEGGDLANVLLQAIEIREKGGKLQSSQAAVVAMAIGYILDDEAIGGVE
ncbi:hypothetical protein TrLO_g13555 [Triparma laevis f. longispina]|uniref:Uncharacterized protein n=2 Tax=Triparma laevis TaxID=1534972 RepID=A0A9W7C234_9STRA|nr:hypothetical protein TrLO_g13555 [Triparma laevis f. longispina]